MVRATPSQSVHGTIEWGHGYGVFTSSAIANLLAERSAQFFDSEPEISASHRRLVMAAADRHFESDPDPAVRRAGQPFSTADAATPAVLERLSI